MKDPIELNKKQKLYDKLGEDGLPAGKLYKRYTGIGATTAEIKAKRNSIIVVPTQAVAYSKVKDNTKSKPLYVGGPYHDIEPPSDFKIAQYIESNNPKYKKLIVVVNSFKQLYSEFSETLSAYFLLIDEIDAFQVESSFRPSMEDAMDFYWEHPKDQRCMVTATPIDFQVKDGEDITPVVVEDYIKPKLKIIKVEKESVNSYLIKAIKEIIERKDDIKTLIAYNSIKYIMNVAEILIKEKTVDESDIGVLCSASSASDVDPFYSQVGHDGYLPDKKIIFMTSAYFSGLDIKDKCRLFMVSGGRQKHHFLTTRRIIQIAGRKRNEKEKNLLLISNKTFDPVNLKELKDKIIQDQKQFSEFNKCIKELSTELQFINFYRADLVDGVMDKAKALRVMRKDRNGNMVPSNFKFDFEIHQADEFNKLYSPHADLEKELSKHFKVSGKPKEYDTPIITPNISKPKHKLLNKKKEYIEQIKSLDYQLPELEATEKVPAFEKQIKHMMTHMELKNIVYSMENYGLSKNGESDRVFESYHIFSSSHEAMELYREKLREGFKIGTVYSSSQIYNKLLSYHRDVTRRRSPLIIKGFKQLSGEKFFWTDPDAPITTNDRDRRKAEKSLSRIRCVFKIKDNHRNGYEIEKLNPFELEIEDPRLYDM